MGAYTASLYPLCVDGQLVSTQLNMFALFLTTILVFTLCPKLDLCG